MFERLDRLVLTAIGNNVFPGIEILVARGPEQLLHATWGRTAGPDSDLLAKNTVFDLASLTKPVATATLLVKLFESGDLSLADQVRRYFPEFSGGLKDFVTLGQLAVHNSGLDAHVRLSDNASDAKSARAALMRLPLKRAPGAKVRYSCLGYLVLGEVIAKVAGEPLDGLFNTMIARPLGISDTCFRPLDAGIRTQRVAPTAPPVEQRGALHGIVNDSNSRLLGGRAGNAGLFGTARDLHRFCVSTLRGKNRLVFENCCSSDDTPRSVGWEVKLIGHDECSCGPGFPDGAIGHTGFTGTSIWMDPRSELIVLALSNRSYMTKRGNIEEMKRFRKQLHQTVAQQFGLAPNI